MNTLPIHNFPNFALSFFRENIDASVTPEDNKIVAIAVLAFACLAALYYFGCCCFKNHTFALDEPDDTFDYPDGSQAVGKFTRNWGGLEEFKGKISDFHGKKIEEGEFRSYGEYSKPVLKKGKRTENGIIEEGEFESKKLEKGKKTFPDGTILNGEFDRHENLVEGTRILPNGTREEGKFKDDKLDGKGKVIIPKGDTIEGFFKDGKVDGFGRIIHHDGSIQEGLFEKGELKEERKPSSTKVTTKGSSPKSSTVTAPPKPAEKD